MTEVWKDIEGYENKYQVSNKGRIRFLAQEIKCAGKGGGIVTKKYKEKILNGTKLKNKDNIYIILSKVVDGKQIKNRFMLGQLVAKAFVDNPNGYKYVKHLDGDQGNNNADNLQWVEWKNAGAGLKKRPVMCVTTNEVYPSTWECSRQCNINRSTLRLHILSGTPLNDKLYIFLDE